MSTQAGFPALPFSIATLGIASFACMDALMKQLVLDIGVYNAMLWRSGIALCFALVLFLGKRTRWPAWKVLRLHLWRGAITSLMAFLFFWGLAYVPLAEAIGLSFIAPLIALYLAAVLLREMIGGKAVLASVIGFTGALVIIGGRWSGQYSEDVGRGIVAILLSAVLYAYNLILQRQQALIAGPVEIVLFQNATMFAAYLSLAPLAAVAPAAAHAPYLIVAAALSTVSILLLSWAYARAEAKFLIPVEYTAFIWAALLGWWVFDEAVTTATLCGTALIVLGCLVATREQPAGVEHVESTAL